MTVPRPEAVLATLRPGHPVGIAVHDEQLRFVLITPSLAVVNGLPVEAHLGRRMSELTPGPLGAAVETAMGKALDEDRALTVQLTGEAGPGRATRTWSAHYQPLRGRGRRWVASLVVDVTERVAVQERLRETRAMHAEAERLARLGSYDWEIGADGWTWSEETYRLAGVDPGAQVPDWEAWLATVHPDDATALRDTLRAAVVEGAAFDVAFRQRLPDGTTRVLRTKGGTQRGPDGRAKRLEGFAQDVTELARAERRQQAVADLGRLALEGMELTALATRAAAAVRTALDAAHVRIAGAGGIHAEAGVEGPAPGVTVRVPAGAAAAPWGELAVTGARAFEPDGDAFLQALGGVLAAAAAHREADAEVAAHAAARGRLVAQALDAEDRTRAGISASLERTALRELAGVAAELEGLVPRDERERHHTTHAREAVARALATLREVVSDLDPTGRAGAGAPGLDGALRALGEQQARIGGFAFALAVTPGAAGPWDELVLAVARELLTNAAKHAGARAVALEVRREPAGVVLEVLDDGRGIDPARLQAAAAEGHIGLASSRERVAAAGGSLEVGARPGGGTAARVRLPL